MEGRRVDMLRVLASIYLPSAALKPSKQCVELGPFDVEEAERRVGRGMVAPPG